MCFFPRVKFSASLTPPSPPPRPIRSVSEDKGKKKKLEYFSFVRTNVDEKDTLFFCIQKEKTKMLKVREYLFALKIFIRNVLIA